MVELSDIDGESTTEWVDIDVYSHSKYSSKFLLDYYGMIKENSIYRNKVKSKEVIWQGHIKDLEYMKVNNFLGWKISFDNKYELSNHLPISHWGLVNGSS